MKTLHFVILLCLGLAQSVGAGEKPNFVVIFTDDQGYGDLSCFGGEHVSTPCIDQMAEDGNSDYRARDHLFRQAIAEIDWSVGQILDTLKTNGLDDNTLVVFTSDNGPPKNSIFASPGPLVATRGPPLKVACASPRLSAGQGGSPPASPTTNS